MHTPDLNPTDAKWEKTAIGCDCIGNFRKSKSLTAHRSEGWIPVFMGMTEVLSEQKITLEHMFGGLKVSA